MTKSICFLTPVYGGLPTVEFTLSMLELTDQLRNVGIEYEVGLGSNESLVQRARMAMIGSFLRDTDCDYAMFIDADIQFGADDVAKVWNLLQEPDKEIVVGVYPMKKPDEDWYAAWVDGKLVKDLNQFDGPIAVDYAGTGFMAISRKALLDVSEYLHLRHKTAKELIARLGEDLPEMESLVAKEMVDSLAPTWTGPEGDNPALFMCPTLSNEDGEETILESEDYNFCRMARQAGHKVWMDPSIRLLHIGRWAYGLHNRT